MVEVPRGGIEQKPDWQLVTVPEAPRVYRGVHNRAALRRCGLVVLKQPERAGQVLSQPALAGAAKCACQPRVLAGCVLCGLEVDALECGRDGNPGAAFQQARDLLEVPDRLVSFPIWAARRTCQESPDVRPPKFSWLCGGGVPGCEDGEDLVVCGLTRAAWGKPRGDYRPAQLDEHVLEGRLGLGAVPGLGGAAFSTSAGS